MEEDAWRTPDTHLAVLLRGTPGYRSYAHMVLGINKWNHKGNGCPSCDRVSFWPLGMLWFNLAYKPSVQTIEEREQEKWAKFRPKIKKAGKNTAGEILANILRYHLVDDNLAGDLDTDTPLAVWDNQLMTLEDVMAVKDEGNQALLKVQTDAIDYLQIITMDLAGIKGGCLMCWQKIKELGDAQSS